MHVIPIDPLVLQLLAKAVGAVRPMAMRKRCVPIRRSGLVATDLQMLTSRLRWTLGLAAAISGCAGLHSTGNPAGKYAVQRGTPPLVAFAASPNRETAAEPPDVSFAHHLPDAAPEPLDAPVSGAAPLEPPRKSAGPVREAAFQSAGERAPAPEAVEPRVEAQTIDLPTALSIAGGQNPQIAFAAARYREAYARLEAARVLWLPSIRAGFSYHHHDGNLQNAQGNIIDPSRSSLQTGLGVGAVGAGTTPVPGVVMQFHTSDAIFRPQIAEYAASADRAGMRTVTNDTLLRAALAYLELLRAYQELRIREDTRANVQDLADLTQAYAETGQGLRSDADRMAAELFRRTNDISRAEEAARVAAARLAEVLSADPTVPIEPQEPTVVPIDLVGHEAPVGELVATGLSNRPELAEAQYLVCEAVHRYRRERYAPLLPSVLLGISQTGFGGGIGSEVGRYDDRFDFDAVAYWEVRNFGAGEAARQDETQATYDRARARQVQLLDQVAREVVEAHAQVTARRAQIATAEEGIEAAASSYRRNLDRIEQGQGLPIEVLQSIQALDDARREYLRAVVDYNAAQFSLQRALGWAIHPA
jgi:outer membrane protein TolC